MGQAAATDSDTHFRAAEIELDVLLRMRLVQCRCRTQLEELESGL